MLLKQNLDKETYEDPRIYAAKKLFFYVFSLIGVVSTIDWLLRLFF